MNDLRKPDSISRRTVNTIVNRFKTKQIKDDRKKSQEIEGSYSVIDTEKGE